MWQIVLEGDQKNGVEKKSGKWVDLFLHYVDILHDLFSRQIITGERKAQHGKKSM